MNYRRIDDGKGRFAHCPSTFCQGRFEVIKVLGQGGQGYALLARDTWCGALVVIKGSWWEPDQLQPTQAEARYEALYDTARDAAHTLASITQLAQRVPLLVDAFQELSPTRLATGRFVPPDWPEADTLNQEWFVVQQFLGNARSRDALTLGDWLQHHGPLDEADLLDLLDQMCATLNGLHLLRQAVASDNTQYRYYYCHCDIKPDNILVVPPNRYFLIDMDAALEVDAKNPVYPAFYTQGYAPADRHEAASVHFDLHCLAATLLEAATGLPPEIGQSDPRERRLATQDALRERGLNPLLIRLIVDCLSQQPGHRLRSARVLRQESARIRQALILRDYLQKGH